uniref:AAA_12 domain-containing protein n=1 Tax=Haemonchus contortus TaxID=6289 RepID=A0A7I5E7P7_HAECO
MNVQSHVMPDDESSFQIKNTSTSQELLFTNGREKLQNKNICSEHRLPSQTESAPRGDFVSEHEQDGFCSNGSSPKVQRFRKVPEKEQNRDVALNQDTSSADSADDKQCNPNVLSKVFVPVLPLLGPQNDTTRTPSAISSQSSPKNINSHLIKEHPWAKYVTVSDQPLPTSENSVTSSVPLDVYCHIPTTGYFSHEFVQSLFPRQNREHPNSSEPLTIFELMRLQNAVDFREHSLNIIHQLSCRGYLARENNDPKTPPGSMATTILPLSWHSSPVLYQVVSRNSSEQVILEAKDFFIVGPDRGELQCIVLDQFSTNIKSGTRGFDGQLLSVKDFVWVYSLEPTAEAVQKPSNVLAKARAHRTTALDTSVPYFFRVREFVFVTPPKATHYVYGLVVEDKSDNSTSYKVVFESVPDVVTVPHDVFQFPTQNVKKYDIVLAETRDNVSTAIRFSESPASVDDQVALCNLVREFIPSHPQEGLLPLKIFEISREDREWTDDRIGKFMNYSKDPHSAHTKMTQLFNVAICFFFAFEEMDDDKFTRRVTATVLSTSAFPVRFLFKLNSNTESGWNSHRIVFLWIIGSASVVSARVESIEANFYDGTLSIQLVALPRFHHALMRAISRYSWEENGTLFVEMCVKLDRLPVSTVPILHIVSQYKLFDNISRNSRCQAEQVLDAVYNNFSQHKFVDVRLPNERREERILFDGKLFDLHPGQLAAIRLGCGNHPIVAIQGGYGTGKTLVAALIAAKCARQRNGFVVVLATSNGAVAQITNTILGLEQYKDLSVLRYVHETLCSEKNFSTDVDMNLILKRLPDDYAERLAPEDLRICLRFKERSELLEKCSTVSENVLLQSPNERRSYNRAVKELTSDLHTVFRLMFALRTPNVICMTVSALLGATKEKGMIYNYLQECHTIIGDNASHIPEPDFVAIANCLYNARHVYVGDIHQLRPHIHCDRNSLPVTLGARGLMELLIEKHVPTVSMFTTFRIHPELAELPNELFYDYALIDGVSEHERRLFLDHIRYENSDLPFLFVDIPDQSRLPRGGSHFNNDEVKSCCDIVTSLLERGIPPKSLVILALYKEQTQRLKQFAKKHSVDLFRVGAFQSLEKDIVVLLTSWYFPDGEVNVDFLNDSHRINVALTRCRHGQFVLGSKRFLSTLSSWAPVIRWARLRNAVIDKDDLGRILA